MKCVIKNKILKRVDNETAEEMVDSGWDYAPKSLWKEHGRHKEIEIQNIQILSKSMVAQTEPKGEAIVNHHIQAKGE